MKEYGQHCHGYYFGGFGSGLVVVVELPGAQCRHSQAVWSWHVRKISATSWGDWRIGNTKTWQLQVIYTTYITTFVSRGCEELGSAYQPLKSKMIFGCVSTPRQRGCVNIYGHNHIILVRLIGRSSHNLDIERLIGRSAYLILEGQICLLLC